MTKPAASRSRSQQPAVHSMGCRLNALEGDIVARRCAQAGLRDAVVINSCAVTNEAVRQSRQAVRRAVRDNPAAKVFVTGCAAQIDPAAFAREPGVAGVVGNAEKLEAATWRGFADAPTGENRVVVDDIMAVRETAAHMSDAFGERTRAFVQIQNGCDHRCTFCVIPYGRGPARSAPTHEVVAAVRRLADAGVAEIVLTGVDVTSWGSDLDGRPALGSLVAAALDGAPNLTRLRLSSIDGAEIDPELFDRLTGDDRVAPYLHLSVQAGDDMILKRMRRRHSRGDIIALAERLRARRPDIALGADLIAGFPTETEAMFDNTLRLIHEAALNYCHVFPFSPRDGAPAARMPQTPRDVVKARAARLRAAAADAEAAFLRGLVGTTRPGVVETGARARLDNFAVVSLSERDEPNAEHEKGAPHGRALNIHIDALAAGRLIGRPAA